MKIVTVTRKPCTSSSTTGNVVEHDAGAINIEASRIGFADAQDLAVVKMKNPSNGGAEAATSAVYGAKRPQGKVTETGRWPANLILQHKSGCKRVGTTTVPGYTINRWTDGAKPFGGGAGHEYESERQPDEEVPVWECEDGCAVRGLDGKYTPPPKAGNRRKSLRGTTDGGVYGAWGPVSHNPDYFKDDNGTASRFFKQVQGTDMNDLSPELIDYLTTMISPPPECEPLVLIELNLDDVAWEQYEDSSVHGIITVGNPEPHMDAIDRVLRPGAHLLVIAPDEEPAGYPAACAIEDFGYEIRDAIALLDEPGGFHYVAKASSAERNAGILLHETETGRKVQNEHPTVKSIGVMEALLHDVPKGALVVDPFMGSGTTGIACLHTGHNFIGIDQDENYLRIADQRIRHWDRAKNAWNGATIESEAEFEESEEPMELDDLFGLAVEDPTPVGDCRVCGERDEEEEIKEGGERFEVCSQCAADRPRVRAFLAK